jgi:ribosomal protein S20
MKKFKRRIMMKKIVSLVLAWTLIMTAGVAYAAGNMTKIEKKYLEFYKALMEQKVKDRLISKEDANKKIADLEKKMKESEGDIIYKRFSMEKRKDFSKGELNALPKERKEPPKKPLETREKSDETCPVPGKEKAEQMRQRQEKFIKIYSELTGKSIDEIKTECEKQDKNVWQLAHAQGNLTRFKEAVLAQAKADIELKVKEGKVTKEKGEEILKRITEHINKIDFKE